MLSSRHLSSLLLLLVLSLCTALPAVAQSVSSSNSDVTEQQIHYEWAHGALMSAAIGVFFPLGIAFARFCRSPQLSPAWLRLHQAFVTIGIVLLIAGFAIAVNQLDSLDYSKTENNYHRIAGYIVFALFLLQFVLGFVRPHAPPIGSGEKLSERRRVWNVVHHWNGRIAYVFGIAQIYTGIKILDGGSETLWEALFSGIWGALFLLLILLQIVVCVKGSALGDDGTATKTTVFGSTVDRLDNSAAATTSAAVRKGNDVPAHHVVISSAEMTQISEVRPSEPSSIV